MPKKNEPVQPETAPVSIISQNDVTARFDLAFTKEDMVNIRMAEEETRLIKTEDAIQAELNAAQKQRVVLSDNLRKALAVVRVLPEIEKAVELINRTFALELEPSVDVHLHTVTADNEAECRRLWGQNLKQGDYLVSEAHRLDAISDRLVKKVYRRPTKAEHALIASVGAADQEIEGIEERLVAARQALAKLPQLRRQLEAHMAKIALERTVQGKELMASLTKHVPPLLLE